MIRYQGAEQELYDNAFVFGQKFNSRTLLCPISDSSISLANALEDGLDVQDYPNISRLNLEKGGYFDDEMEFYEHAIEVPKGVRVCREITTPPEAISDLDIVRNADRMPFDYIVIFDDASHTGKNAIGGYIWGVQAKALLAKQFPKEQPPQVVLYIDRDGRGVAHVTRVPEYLNSRGRSIDPDSFIKQYFPQTYDILEDRGLVPQRVRFPSETRRPVPRSPISYPIRGEVGDGKRLIRRKVMSDKSGSNGRQKHWWIKIFL